MNDKNVENSFEDEFDFLEEDEFQEETNGPVVESSEKKAKFPLFKWLFIISFIAIGIFFMLKTLAKKSTESLTTTIAAPQQNIEKKSTKNTEKATTLDNAAIQTKVAKKADEPAKNEDTNLFATTDLPEQEATNSDSAQSGEGLEKGFAELKTDDLFFGSNQPSREITEHFSNQKAADAKTQQLPEIHTAIGSITQEITENVNQIKQLEQKIDNISNVLAKVSKSINAMDNRVLGLTETVDSLNQDVSNVKKIIKDEDLDLTSSTAKSSADAPLTYQSPGYVIHAIIPGRAWLKSSAGQIMTVAEGDVIGDYGTVAVIDAANNIVRTSSGVSFR